MSVRAIAWDVDGTLIDSEPIHLRALLAVCAQADVDISDLPDYRFHGVALPDVWRSLQPRFPASTSWVGWNAAIEAAYLAELGQTSVPRVAFEALSRLAGLGLVNVAVSNSNRSIVEANLEALGLARLLRFSITLDDVRNPKPHPEPYRMAAERLGVQPAQMVAVEDSPAGAKSAWAAGCPVIMIGRATPPRGILPVATLADLAHAPAVVAGLRSTPHQPEAEGSSPCVPSS